MAPRNTREVGLAEARRIAVRAQVLDGSAQGVLDTVRRLGFLQLDPIATVATPQELVLWSRLGPFDRAELDRLLWDERALFEWNAYIWPIETLPLVRGLMRRWRRSTRYAHERWGHAFLAENRPFRRYVLRGYYVLPILVGDRIVGRVEPVLDRKTRMLRILGEWGDTSRLDEAMAELATFLDAELVPRAAVSRRRSDLSRRSSGARPPRR